MRINLWAHRLSQPNFDHVVPPTKFKQPYTFFTDGRNGKLNSIKCIEVIKSTKWLKLGWVTKQF